jgi:hypothetical protein
MPGIDGDRDGMDGPLGRCSSPRGGPGHLNPPLMCSTMNDNASQPA